MTERVRVMLVDDHPLVRSGLTQLLDANDGLVVVGSASGGKQIARRLGISEKTVKAHLTNVFQSIGVQGRTEAAWWAQERTRRS